MQLVKSVITFKKVTTKLSESNVLYSYVLQNSLFAMRTASCVQNGTDIWLTVGVDIDDDRLWVGSNAVVIGDEGNETLVRRTVYIVGSTDSYIFCACACCLFFLN